MPLQPLRHRLTTVALSVSVLLVPLGAAEAATAPPPVRACALGAQTPGLGSTFARAVHAAASTYGASLRGIPSAAAQRQEQAFAAAAVAYAYGMPPEILRATIKGYVRNEIVNVNALATPSTQGVVSPNVDTAYSVAWIDLTSGPEVVNVPDTGGRFYTFQFMDAYTNAFSYVGTGSTGTRAGAYAIVPPGWSGTLPAGVVRIQSPTNTVWLLGRTLVDGPGDFPAVKQIQQQYALTPLSAWELGTREPSVTIDSYPAGRRKTLPAGTAFISTLNRQLTIDPPPAADGCALSALAPAGVTASHPTQTQSLTADLADIAGAPPDSPQDASTRAAVDAGVAAGPRIVASATARLLAVAARGNHGWDILNHSIGTYGTEYVARAVIATDFLGANIPAQGLYPIAYVDVAGRTLNGAADYTMTFPRGLLPPARAFWSLTMYDSADYLYANPLNRYAVGNRTAGLVRGRDGSLTLRIQHTAPGGSARANWLPAPAGVFHLILRLYQPSAAALNETWKPPPVFRVGEVLRPVLSRVTVSGRVLRYADSQHAVTRVTIFRGRRAVARLAHHDRPGANRISLGRHRLRPGSYRLVAQATGARAEYDNAPGRPVSRRFRVA